METTEVSPGRLHRLRTTIGLKLGVVKDQVKVQLPSKKVRKLLGLNKVCCTICLDEYTNRKLVCFSSSCSHLVCKSCVEKFVSSEILKVEGTELLCPFQEENCGNLNPKSLKKLLKTSNRKRSLEAAYLRQGILSLEIFFRCPNDTCNNVVFLEDALDEEDYIIRRTEETERTEEIKLRVPVISSAIRKSLFCMGNIPFRLRNPGRPPIKYVSQTEIRVIREQREIVEYRINGECDLRSFDCEACLSSFCVLCRLPWTVGDSNHNAISCTEYFTLYNTSLRENEEEQAQAEIMRRRLAGTLKFCPSCDSRIERNGGCNHMTCRSCAFQFCWVCLATWRQCNH